MEEQIHKLNPERKKKYPWWKERPEKKKRRRVVYKGIVSMEKKPDDQLKMELQ
jgi:hypothetical protein